MLEREETPLGLRDLGSLHSYLHSFLGLASQESSPAPQFESIHSSVLSLLCGPALTSVHDYYAAQEKVTLRMEDRADNPVSALLVLRAQIRLILQRRLDQFYYMPFSTCLHSL